MSTPKKIEAKNGVTGKQKLLKTFTVDYVGDDGTRYRGKFTTKKLSIADLSSLGVRKSQLNGGMYHDPKNPGMGVDSQTDDFNSMIAHLDVALKEWPEWWNLEEIVDAGLLATVFEEVISHENSFLYPRGGNSGIGDSGGSVAHGSGEGSRESDSQEADSSGRRSPVVEQEVQSALEP